MARPLRIEFENAVYHVTARGNARAAIFLDDADRRCFLELLGQVVQRHNWLCHAYVLMGNHYHLMIETPDANLSSGMRQLNGVYTQRFNRAHGRGGHLLQGRFTAILVDKDAYLLELCRYLPLNPVRAGLAGAAKDWSWSSYRATAGLSRCPAFLTTDWVLGRFGRKRGAAEAAFRAFVAEGRGAAGPWDELRGQIVLGDDRFARRVIRRARKTSPLAEVPRAQRFAGRPPLVELFAGAGDRRVRDARIRAAAREHGYSLSDIGRALGLHVSTTSRIVAGGGGAKNKT